MIVVKEFQERQFADKEELFKALKENKSTLIAQKKMITKHADATYHYVMVEDSKGETVKAESNSSLQDANSLKLKLVINTTNILDSHGDVHVKGIWNKSVKESKGVLLLQEHSMTFKSIIGEGLTPSVKKMQWYELGQTFKGDTEALVFSGSISKDRNPFMFEQYAKGYVKEHSVGMRYIKVELAINSEKEYYKEEKELWDNYIETISNKETAEEIGYFWVVKEARIVEGSAVVKGSNPVTPVLNIQADKSLEEDKTEPSSVDTQKYEQQLKELLTKI